MRSKIDDAIHIPVNRTIRFNLGVPVKATFRPELDFNNELLKLCKTGNRKDAISLIRQFNNYKGSDENVLNFQLRNVCRAGKLELVKELLKLGADINTQNVQGWTPLHFAISSVQTHVVKYLVENGADVTIENTDGDTPFYFAVHRGTYRSDIYFDLVITGNSLIHCSDSDLFKFAPLIHKKQKKETKAQSILDYFLEHKSNYAKEDIQEFKKEFLRMEMNEEDSRNLKSIVKFI